MSVVSVCRFSVSHAVLFYCVFIDLICVCAVLPWRHHNAVHLHYCFFIFYAYLGEVSSHNKLCIIHRHIQHAPQSLYSFHLQQQDNGTPAADDVKLKSRRQVDRQLRYGLGDEMNYSAAKVSES